MTKNSNLDLNDKKYNLLGSSRISPKEKEFKKVLDIGELRYVYELWDTSEKAISYLYNNCVVFDSAKKVVESTLEEYGNSFKIKEIHCIRDTYCNDDMSSTEYLVCIANENDLGVIKDVKLLIQQGGYYKDVMIFEDNEFKSITKIGDLSHPSRIDCLNRIKNSIEEYFVYKDILMKSIC